MRVNSARYGQRCAHCSQRVRVGKQFVVDPVDSGLIWHEQCAELASRAK